MLLGPNGPELLYIVLKVEMLFPIRYIKTILTIIMHTGSPKKVDKVPYINNKAVFFINLDKYCQSLESQVGFAAKVLPRI